MTKTKDTLGHAIEAWSKRKSAVVNDLHNLVVRCICHTIEHSDPHYINKLDVAVSDGTDDKGKSVSGINLFSFRKYIETKAPVTWQRADKTTGKAEHFAFDKTKAETIRPVFDANPKAFADELAATPFWRVIKAPDPFEGFDFKKELARLIAKGKRLFNDPSKKDKVDITGIERVEKIAKDLETAANKPVVLKAPEATEIANKPKRIRKASASERSSEKVVASTEVVVH